MIMDIKENSQFLVFELDMSNEKLALEELKILLGKPILVENGHALIEVRKAKNDSKKEWNLPLLILDNLKRLAFLRTSYLYLFSAKDAKDFSLEIAKFDWKKVFEKDLSFRKKEGFCKNLKALCERKIGGTIWDAMLSQGIKPKVNLSSAKTVIEAIEFDKRIVFLKKAWNRENLELRRPIKRTGFHPSGIHPKIARACINISGKTTGKLLDPFCGSGGILIESALLGFETYGIDCDERMVKRCERNLLDLGLKANVKLGDAFKTKRQYDLVVTDPPYGKNSPINSGKKDANKDKREDINFFYIKFLKRIKENTSNIVMIFPSFANWKGITKESGWLCDFSTEIYVHKSLSRIITRLKKFD
jgi:tRNA (guanine10-N2)-dimethyltransferase